MNPTTSPDDHDLVWPPPEDDLDAIEVLDLHAVAAAATTTTSPSRPDDAGLDSEPPSPPLAGPPNPRQDGAVIPGEHAGQAQERDESEPAAAPMGVAPDEPVGQGSAGGVTEILQLDAVSGQESYLVDIHPFPRAPAPEPTPVAELARQDAEELLEWPPREADLDAIDVVPLGESPGTTDAAAQGSGGAAVSPATPVPPSPTQDLPGPAVEHALGTDGGTEPNVAAPAAEPSAPVRTALDAWEGGGAASAPSPWGARALAVIVVAALAAGVWFGVWR